MTVYEIDPLQDPRWPDLLKRHDGATIFHTPEWLESLQLTYRYRPAALTSSRAGEPLRDGLLFCRVKSWLTGTRLVGAPFSDHCSPLCERMDDFEGLWRTLNEIRERERARYVEIRLQESEPGRLDHSGFCLHKLSLRSSPTDLFHALHQSCIRRKLTRARREGLVFEEGTSESILRAFYGLIRMTRRRHGLPAPPLAWYRNLMACLRDRVKIRLATYRSRPIAAILTIGYKSTMTYKYGSSDQRYHRLGAMPSLLWGAIEAAQRDGFLEFDMGRTDWTNTGLLTFKDHWGAARFPLHYLRSPEGKPATEGLPARLGRMCFSKVPGISLAGSRMYRHIG